MSEGEKPIPFAPDYTVASDGRVFSTKFGRKHELAAACAGDYPRVSLRANGVSVKVRVHRLVCLLFNGYPPEGRGHVRHLDGDPMNNHHTNLAWGTPSENMVDMCRHGRAGRGRRLSGESHPLRVDPSLVARGSKNGRAVLTEESVASIRARIVNGERVTDLAQEFQVSKYTLYHMKWGKTWGHVSRMGELKNV